MKDGMSNPKHKHQQADEAVEKLDVESLIVDLLACGLGAVIILFFIFSVNIIGHSESNDQAASTTAKSAASGRGSGVVSLIGDEGDPSKRMGSVRMIELRGLSDDNFRAIRAYAGSDGRGFWEDFREMQDDEKLFNSIRTQIMVKKESITFILIADGIRNFAFSFPKGLQPVLTDLPRENGKVVVSVLEGQSAKGRFNGYFRSDELAIQSLKKFRLRMRIGKISNDLGKLITIES